MPTAVAVLGLKQIFIHCCSEAQCTQQCVLSVTGRVSISVRGGCGLVRTLLFGNALHLGACLSMAVLHNCCLLEHCRETDTCISLVKDCTVKAAWNVWVFFFLVEIFVGFNDVVFCSVLILQKCELVMFEWGYCV